jgi:hypothetical protein
LYWKGAHQLKLTTMRAKRIIRAGAFAPEDLVRLQAAFELAWQRIRPTVKEIDYPRAREDLAIVVVSAGTVSGLDHEELAAFAQRTYSTISAANPNS